MFLNIYNNCRLVNGAFLVNGNRRAHNLNVVGIGARTPNARIGRHYVNGLITRVFPTVCRRVLDLCTRPGTVPAALIKFRGRSNRAILNSKMRPLTGAQSNFNGGTSTRCRNTHCDGMFNDCVRKSVLPGGPRFTSCLLNLTLHHGCKTAIALPILPSRRRLTTRRCTMSHCNQ